MKAFKETDGSRSNFAQGRERKLKKNVVGSATSSAGKLGRFKPGCVKHSPHARRKLALHR